MSVDAVDKIHVKLLSSKEYRDFEKKEIVITDFTVDSPEFKSYLDMTEDIDRNNPMLIKEKARDYFSSKNQSLAKIRESLTSDKLFNNTIYFYVSLAEYFQLLFPTFFAMLEYYTVNKRRYEFIAPEPVFEFDEEESATDEDIDVEEDVDAEKNDIDEEEDEISDLEDLEENGDEEQEEEKIEDMIEEDQIPERPEEPKVTKRTDIKLPSVGRVPTPQISITAIEEYINFIPKIRTRVIDKNAPKKEIENRADETFKPMKTFELADGFSRHDFDHVYRDAKGKPVIVTITDIRFK